MKELLETVRVIDGKFDALEMHLERMERSSLELFGTPVRVDLSRNPIPEDLMTGVVKCRVVYSPLSVKVEYAAYVPKVIRSLRLMADETIDYHLKYADRSALAELTARKGNCSDILIVKHGRITDTSYSNVVFQKGDSLVVPEDYLLAGCRRRQLIEEGKVRVEALTPDDLSRFDTVHLINAMLDPGQVCIPVPNVF